MFTRLSGPAYALPLLLTFITLAGCATPASVKSLSQEQVKVQIAYFDIQKKYFSLIEAFVESQIKTAEILIDVDTKEITTKYKQKTLSNLDSNDKAKNKELLDGLVDSVLNEYKSDNEKINRLNKLLFDIKQKHRDMLYVYEKIVLSQKKLDEYLQIEKADEIFINELLALIETERGKIELLFDSASNIFNEIQKITKGE